MSETPAEVSSENAQPGIKNDFEATPAIEQKQAGAKVAAAPPAEKSAAEAKPAAKKAPPKPPKPEDKPFAAFINEELLPALTKAFAKQGFPSARLEFTKGMRPVVGGECSMVVGELLEGRRFWLCFQRDEIGSGKTFSLAEAGTEPSLLEPFLIDERKTTLLLLVSRIMQRLNGQKWLGDN